MRRCVAGIDGEPTIFHMHIVAQIGTGTKMYSSLYEGCASPDANLGVEEDRNAVHLPRRLLLEGRERRLD